MTITFIAAVARNGVVGRDGRMPWRIPGEQKGFKAATMGHPMVMGRHTFESHGLLPGRRHIVLTRDLSWSADGVEVAHSVDEALLLADDEDFFVTGGAQVWELFASYADRMVLSEIPLDPEGDTVFPGWPFTDSPVWREASRKPHDGWTVVTYERRNPRTQVEVGPGVAAASATQIKAGVTCAIGDGERLLLTRRQDNGLWCLPGGAAEIGETWSQSAVREAHEETGLEVAVDSVLAAYSRPDIVIVHPDGRRRTPFGVCFRAHVVGGTAGVSDEVSESRWFMAQEAARLPIIPAHRPLVRAFFETDSGVTLFD
ncbi:dihydrofolate reductase [Flexivirga caeni]|uniref:NUDIX domain-containing protein n=1 Tax=Flexivirga caeni TaxID=2294115 RepID=A0A3M9M947_9MICO|nr:dihydrofolate reductase [Flexivirga caeni]RNI21393.1 NUDIX domain-containing protein [Flexivirga caeni]